MKSPMYAFGFIFTWSPFDDVALLQIRLPYCRWDSRSSWALGQSKGEKGPSNPIIFPKALAVTLSTFPNILVHSLWTSFRWQVPVLVWLVSHTSGVELTCPYMVLCIRLTSPTFTNHSPSPLIRYASFMHGLMVHFRLLNLHSSGHTHGWLYNWLHNKSLWRSRTNYTLHNIKINYGKNKLKVKLKNRNN